MGKFRKGQTVHFAGNGSILMNLIYHEPLNERLSWCEDLAGRRWLLETGLLLGRWT